MYLQLKWTLNIWHILFIHLSLSLYNLNTYENSLTFLRRDVFNTFQSWNFRTKINRHYFVILHDIQRVVFFLQTIKEEYFDNIAISLKLSASKWFLERIISQPKLKMKFIYFVSLKWYKLCQNYMDFAIHFDFCVLLVCWKVIWCSVLFNLRLCWFCAQLQLLLLPQQMMKSTTTWLVLMKLSLIHKIHKPPSSSSLSWRNFCYSDKSISYHLFFNVTRLNSYNWFKKDSKSFIYFLLNTFFILIIIYTLFGNKL